jgi:hypothetical protein
LAARFRDPEAARGNLAPPGEPVAGEMPAEYAGRIGETIPAQLYTADELIAMHRQRNVERRPPRPSIAPFNTHRSLRRG